MKALEDAQTLLKELAYPVDVDDPKAGCFFGVRGGVTQMVFGLELFSKVFVLLTSLQFGFHGVRLLHTEFLRHSIFRGWRFPLVGSSQRPLAKLSVGPSTPNSRAGPGA